MIASMMKKMKKESMIPMPSNINIWWNLGSLIGLCLMMQIMTGLILSMNYCPSMNNSFESIIYITQNVNSGWLIRYIHINGASMFFLTMYMHILRGIHQLSYKLTLAWIVGTAMIMLSMMTAFMGYILPWGQMSFWGATVITNLISVLPYMGQTCVEWVWGGYSVSNPTINRFFTLHFITPIVIMVMAILHLMSIHMYGSTNPMGVQSTMYMLPFHPYFTIKDLVGMALIIMTILSLSLMNPDLLTDPDNYLMANPLVTPKHIKPEWYFLMPYAILRSVPNKMGGVILLLLSILILMILPLFPTPKMNNLKMYPIPNSMFWITINIMIALGWLGSNPLEYPYIQISQLLTPLYFMFLLSINPMCYLWDWEMKKI